MDMTVIKQLQHKIESAVKANKRAGRLYVKAIQGTITYAEASELAAITGTITGSVLSDYITKAYPDGVIPEIDAVDLIPPQLRTSHSIVAQAAKSAQTTLNRRAGIGLSPIEIPFDHAKAVDVARDISVKGAGTLAEAVKAACRSVVDESVKANAAAHERVGMEVKVIRTYDGEGLHGGKDPCQWCMSRAGTWSYQDALAHGVFHRHPGCGCEIEYHTSKSVKVQTDWTQNLWEEVGRRR